MNRRNPTSEAAELEVFTQFMLHVTCSCCMCMYMCMCITTWTFRINYVYGPRESYVTSTLSKSSHFSILGLQLIGRRIWDSPFYGLIRYS